MADEERPDVTVLTGDALAAKTGIPVFLIEPADFKYICIKNIFNHLNLLHLYNI